MTYPLTNHPCPNCVALYHRIDAANSLALACKPITDFVRIANKTGDESPMALDHFDARKIAVAWERYASIAIDSEIARAIKAEGETAPTTE